MTVQRIRCAGAGSRARALAASALTALVACSPPPSTDGGGPGVPAKRIVSLSCAATDVVALLGELPRLLAVEEDCPCAGTEGLAKILNQDHPGKVAPISVESVLALGPDAVIAKPDLRDAFEGRGLRVAWTPSAATWASIPTLVETVSSLLGVAARGQALLDRMRDKEAAIRARTGALPRVRVYYETTGLGWTAGRSSVIDAMITLAGGENIANAVEKPAAVLAAEAILEADPEVIVLGAFAESAAEVGSRPGWDRIAAVRLGRVHHLSPSRRAVTLASPRCVDECEALLLPWLHPEVAPPEGR